MALAFSDPGAFRHASSIKGPDLEDFVEKLPGAAESVYY
jgi:hypothetical protein